MNVDQVNFDELAKEFYNLRKEIKEKQNRLDEIKFNFKSRGSFFTMEFLVSVKELKREIVGPSSLVIQTLGKHYLDSLGLIYNQSYLIVDVAPRALPQSFL